MKAKAKNCCNCNEEIVRGMAFPLMEKEHCFKCEYAFIKALWALNYKQTQMGNWYRCTPDRKIVRIYDELLTNIPTYSVSRLEGKL